MKIEAIIKYTEYIDGQLVYILDAKESDCFDKLKELSNLEGTDFFLESTTNLVEFASVHEGFAVAFYQINLKITKWMPFLIYMYDGFWRRVQIEKASCLECDWNGNVANPTVPGLYDTVQKHFNVLHTVNNLSFFKCPKCGGELSRKAIWIECV